MIPGMSQMAKDVNPQEATKNLKMVEAIISSMTIHERQNPHLLNGSRRRRIATGSGTTVNDVNQLVKQFKDMQKMMKQMGVMGGGNRKKKRGRKGGSREGSGMFGGNLMDMFGGRS
jgi:signal recognition particle subunit SRP54